jgi:hypothetical protein
MIPKDLLGMNTKGARISALSSVPLQFAPPPKILPKRI